MGCLGEIQDGTGNRVQTTSTPLVWGWLNERYVPVETPELSIGTPKPPESDALRERNDSTPESAWAYIDRQAYMASQVGATVQESRTVDQCPECRAAPGTPHAIGCSIFEERLTYYPDPKMCEKTAQVAESVSNAAPSHTAGVRFGRETPTNLRVGAPNEHPAWVCNDCGQDHYGVPNAISTWHTGKCGICGEERSVTEPRDFGGYESLLAAARPFLGAPYVWSCSDCGTVTDIDYGPDSGVCHKRETPPVGETFNVPFPVQSWTFEALIETEIDHLHEIIDDHHDEIVEMARKRHQSGHVEHGSKGYQWDAKTRLRNVLEELSDAPTYLTMGPIE